MVFWKRALITFLAMVIASFVVGLIWRTTFDARIPSYFSGVVGGITALVAWELLKRD